MVRYYLDTSAAMKLVIEEKESGELAQVLDGLDSDDVLVASWLLSAELLCAASRRRGIDERSVHAVLESIVLVDVERSDLVDAPTVGRGLRPQDALHLAAAVRLNAEVLVSYDDEQAEAARRAGMAVLAPGVGTVEVP